MESSNRNISKKFGPSINAEHLIALPIYGRCSCFANGKKALQREQSDERDLRSLPAWCRSSASKPRRDARSALFARRIRLRKFSWKFHRNGGKQSLAYTTNWQGSGHKNRAGRRSL